MTSRGRGQTNPLLGTTCLVSYKKAEESSGRGELTEMNRLIATED
jgi:hypothetical protein